jgi:hypothetical protein
MKTNETKTSFDARFEGISKAVLLALFTVLLVAGLIGVALGYIHHLFTVTACAVVITTIKTSW